MCRSQNGFIFLVWERRELLVLDSLLLEPPQELLYWWSSWFEAAGFRITTPLEPSLKHQSYELPLRPMLRNLHLYLIQESHLMDLFRCRTISRRYWYCMWAELQQLSTVIVGAAALAKDIAGPCSAFTLTVVHIMAKESCTGWRCLKKIVW